jgi:hypothetical protein
MFAWAKTQQKRVERVLLRDVEHPQKFVRAWALDSLATLAQRNPALLPRVRELLTSFARSGSKALATRARRIEDRLSTP